MHLNSPEHLNLIFPQWQGSGPDPILYAGARRIQAWLDHLNFSEVAVPESQALSRAKDILGYTAILSQMEAAAALIQERNPDTIFTVGGDCGVEPAPVSHLNRKAKAGLALVWLDAHGDLNTPKTSPSGHFHGMPLRTLLGEGDPKILNTCAPALAPEQVFLAGARELDPGEEAYLKAHPVTRVSPEALSKDPGGLARMVSEAGFTQVYIHIDLDVLDPKAYPCTKHPTSGGITPDTLCEVVSALADCHTVTGLGIVEFVPKEDSQGLDLIKKITSLLSE